MSAIPFWKFQSMDHLNCNPITEMDFYDFIFDPRQIVWCFFCQILKETHFLDSKELSAALNFASDNWF
jgi:hypothetical protein